MSSYVEESFVLKAISQLNPEPNLLVPEGVQVASISSGLTCVQKNPKFYLTCRFGLNVGCAEVNSRISKSPTQLVPSLRELQNHRERRAVHGLFSEDA